MSDDFSSCSQTRGYKRWENNYNFMGSLSDIKSVQPVQLFQTCNVLNQQFFCHPSSAFKTKSHKQNTKITNKQNDSNYGSSMNNMSHQKEHCKDQLMAKIFRDKPQGLLEIFTVELLELCLMQVEQKKNNKKMKQGNNSTFVSFEKKKKNFIGKNQRKNTEWVNKRREQNENKYLQSIFQLLEKPQFQLLLPPNSNYTGAANYILSQYPQSTLKQLLSKFLIEVIQYPSKDHSHDSILNPNHHHTHTHTQSITYSFRQISTATAINSLSSYPLILDIFIALFRGLLHLGDICQSFDDSLQMEETYDFLASYFGIQASIDTLNKCVFFEQTGVYVLEQDSSHLFMIYKQKINKNLLPIGTEFSISQDSEMRYREDETLSDEFSQIDAQQFSKILNNNIKDTQNTENQNKSSPNVLISNINIEDGFSQNSNEEKQNVKKRKQNIIQSQIINCYDNSLQSSPKMQVREDVKDDSFKIIEKKQNQNSKLFNHKKLLTQISREFNWPQEPDLKYTEKAENESYNIPIKNSIKDYIETPTIFQSQFIDTIHFNELKDNSNFQKYKNNKVFQESRETIITEMKENLPPKVEYFNKKDGILETKREKLEEYGKTSQTFYLTDNMQKKSSSALQSTNYSQNFKSSSHSIWKPIITKPVGTIPWINKNISKQFTSSFILKSVDQPYRSSVKKLKQKARQQRTRLTKLVNSNQIGNPVSSYLNPYGSWKYNPNITTYR